MFLKCAGISLVIPSWTQDQTTLLLWNLVKNEVHPALGTQKGGDTLLVKLFLEFS